MASANQPDLRSPGGDETAVFVAFRLFDETSARNAAASSCSEIATSNIVGPSQ
jgi:hypothetical protein